MAETDNREIDIIETDIEIKETDIVETDVEIKEIDEVELRDKDALPDKENSKSAQAKDNKSIEKKKNPTTSGSEKKKNSTASKADNKNSNNNKDKNKKQKSGLEKKLKIMTMWPVIVMGLVVMVLSYYVFLYTTQKEVYRNLSNSAEGIMIYFNTAFEGDYHVEEEAGNYHLYKGEQDLSLNSEVLEIYKEKTGIDFTVFYLDIRMLSTLKNTDGSSVLLTVVNQSVSDAVINGKQDQYYNNIDINGVKYFACYKPLYNTDGSVAGMVFAGKPTEEIEKESMRSLIWIPVITIVMIVIASWISTFPSRELVNAIKKERKFLDEIAKGNLNAEIDASIVKRNDELGEMGRFSRSVQKFIREMIERDTLTRLYTRRIGQSKIDYVQHQLNNAGVKYCVCMGDIDFFKKVNDTYGHDAGDIVLRDIAHIFNENMLGRGFTIRWGGEEFLIIFEDATLDKAYKHLASIREKVLAHEMAYQDLVIKVTMTFGLVEGDSRHIDDIVKEADNLLYIGKQNGRNQIVTSEAAKKIEEENAAAGLN